MCGLSGMLGKVCATKESKRTVRTRDFHQRPKNSDIKSEKVKKYKHLFNFLLQGHCSNCQGSPDCIAHNLETELGVVEDSHEILDDLYSAIDHLRGENLLGHLPGGFFFRAAAPVPGPDHVEHIGPGFAVGSSIYCDTLGVVAAEDK